MQREVPSIARRRDCKPICLTIPHRFAEPPLHKGAFSFSFVTLPNFHPRFLWEFHKVFVLFVTILAKEISSGKLKEKGVFRVKKILLCLLALLLLCGCAETPQDVPVQPQDSTPVTRPEQTVLPDVGQITSIAPSYDTRYFARKMPLLMEDDAQQAFCEAYAKVLSATKETSDDLPEGDEYAFTINISGSPLIKKYLRLIDAGDNFYLELTQRRADWVLTYTAPTEAVQPLLAFFEGEPAGKPHIEGHPDGRMVSVLERIEKGWPIFEGTVTAVSDQVQEYSLHETLQYGWLYREFTVEVAVCYNGDLKEGDKLTYRVFGGETDDYSFSVENAPQVAVGDYVVIAAPEHSFATAYNVFPATAVEKQIPNIYGKLLTYTDYTFTPPVGFFPRRFGMTEKTYRTYDLNPIRSYNVKDAQKNYLDSRDSLPDRITDRELAELRLEYPRHGVFSSMADYLFPDTWARFASYDLDGVAVLDFIGEYRIQPPRKEMQEGPELQLPLEDGCIYLFARVEEVLIGCEGLKEGDLIPIGLGTSFLYSVQEILGAMEGQRFVCMLNARGQDPEDPYALPNAYSSSMFTTFYLTDHDVVLYFCEEYCTCMDECSGMYLPAFTELIREKLFSD